MELAASEAKRYYPKDTRVSYYFESGGDNYRQPIDLLYKIALSDMGEAQRDERWTRAMEAALRPNLPQYAWA